MNDDLSKYRLKYFSEIDNIIDQIGAEKYFSYQNCVFVLLEQMKPGETFHIQQKVKSENIPVFIKCACLYMFRKAGDCNIVFSEDLSVIEGIKSFNAEQKESKMYQEQVKRMRNEKK